MTNPTWLDAAWNAPYAAESQRRDSRPWFGASQMSEQGYRVPEVCRIVGITYRQLDYWARTELVTPSIRDASGSGSQRLYSFQDLVTLRGIKNLLDTGVSLPRGR